MHLHQHDTLIPTYTRGHKRIDYMFATDNIMPYVVKGGILPFHFLKTTDHRALYVELELQQFLRCQLSTTLVNNTRYLTSKNHRGVRRYRQQLTR